MAHRRRALLLAVPILVVASAGGVRAVDAIRTWHHQAPAVATRVAAVSERRAAPTAAPVAGPSTAVATSAAAPTVAPTAAAPAPPTGGAAAGAQDAGAALVVPAASPAASVTPHRASARKQKSKTASVTYTVKAGDNLYVIAAWFHQHGYDAVYQANKAVIGSDPALIHPGQRIVIVGGHLTP